MSDCIDMTNLNLFLHITLTKFIVQIEIIFWEE